MNKGKVLKTVLITFIIADIMDACKVSKNRAFIPIGRNK